MTGLAASPPVREGEILAGKYRVDRVLGVGGMGVVVAAHHVDLDEKVAIKFLLAEASANPEAVARFAREARAAVKIKSEHVARVSDVGKLENGAPFMVMEYLDGGDLSAWLGQRGALPVDQAVEFVLQACEAIAEAHALGIVHRDLKPSNLFVIRRPDGALSVKVLDFGISKVTNLSGSGSDAAMTRTSALIGSPLYMSPEQMRSPRDVDSRSDIWALGVILYELVAGVPPFGGETMAELVLKIASEQPPPLRDRRPDAPDGLEQVIFRCLDKDRGRRFESVGELAIALLPFAPKRSKTSVERISGVMRAAGFSSSALALPPSSELDQVPAPGARTDASWGRTTVGKGRSPWIALAAVLVVAAAGAGALLLRKPATRAAPASVTPTEVSATEAVVAAAPTAVVTVEVPSAAPSVAPAVTPEPSPARTTSSKASTDSKAKPSKGAPAVPSASGPAPAAKSKPTPTNDWGDGRL